MQALSSSVILQLFFTALCFAIWPFFARIAGGNPYFTGVMVSFGTLVAVTVWGGPRMFEGTSISIKMLAVGLFAGIVNGIGFALYSHVVGAKDTKLSVILPILFVIMILIPVVAGFFMGEPITVKKVIAIALIVLGVWLLFT